jgi:polyhydroxyalkanoate synthesis regulator phasin
MFGNDVEIKELLSKVSNMGEITSGLQQDVKFLSEQVDSLNRRVKYLGDQLKAHESASDAHAQPPAS